MSMTDYYFGDYTPPKTGGNKEELLKQFDEECEYARQLYYEASASRDNRGTQDPEKGKAFYEEIKRVHLEWTCTVFILGLRPKDILTRFPYIATPNYYLLRRTWESDFKFPKKYIEWRKGRGLTMRSISSYLLWTSISYDVEKKMELGLYDYKKSFAEVLSEYKLYTPNFNTDSKAMGHMAAENYIKMRRSKSKKSTTIKRLEEAVKTEEAHEVLNDAAKRADALVKLLDENEA